MLNGLLHDFNHNNLEMLSLVIQQAASNCFHDVSRNLLHYHGIHLASSQSPFAFFDDPIAQARVLCGIAGEILKVTNPKNYLLAIRSKIELFWLRMVQKTRMEVLL